MHMHASHSAATAAESPVFIDRAQIVPVYRDGMIMVTCPYCQQRAGATHADDERLRMRPHPDSCTRPGCKGRACPASGQSFPVGDKAEAE